MRHALDSFIRWLKYTAIPWYTSLGLRRGTITLEVRGRKTGQPVRLSLTSVRHAGARYLVALYDQAQWAKNVRAAHGAATLLSGERQPVRLVEIPQAERAPILLDYVNQRAFSHSGPASARLFFGLTSKPTLADMAALADRYLVFRIDPLDTTHS
ncbi:MAG: nitroreductase family deazaflavin-dependent oxidoreductase [Anaerolineae bacterium]|nr:nitroreductase family deazaflavin-dependent oxidoreductase [Anaerolineae bacterium]